MPPLSKQKRKSKEQSHTINGKYNDKKVCKDNYNSLGFDDTSAGEFFNEEWSYNEDWGDADDSGWDDPEDIEAEIRIHQRLKESDLVWRNDNQLEKIKRGPYKIGKTLKSTYYDKYGPNGSLTKAAAGTKKITNFFKINDKHIRRCFK